MHVNIETGGYIFLNPEGDTSDKPFRDLPIRISRVNLYSPVKDVSVAVDVTPLPPEAMLSEGRIRSMIGGPPEDYRAKIELYDEGNPTVALWMEYQGGVGKRFEYLAGGKLIDVSFPLDNLGGPNISVFTDIDDRSYQRVRVDIIEPEWCFCTVIGPKI